MAVQDKSRSGLSCKVSCGGQGREGYPWLVAKGVPWPGNAHKQAELVAKCRDESDPPVRRSPPWEGGGESWSVEAERREREESPR